MKTIIISLSVLLLIGLPLSGKSQYSVTIGTGTGSSAYPFNAGNGYTRIAALYDSTETDTTGTITTLAWNVSGYNSNWTPVKIYLKTITDATLIADTWSNMISGATLVYNNTINFPNNGWKNINITPFTYSSGNLLVLVETNYGGTGTTTASFYSTISGYNETWYSNVTPPAGNGDINVYGRPNIKITFYNYVGIVENSSSADVNIYPNPSGSTITIHFQNPSAETHTLLIYNTQGQLVQKIENITGTEVKVENRNLQSGLYFFKLQNGEAAPAGRGITGQGKFIIE